MTSALTTLEELQIIAIGARDRTFKKSSQTISPQHLSHKRGRGMEYLDSRAYVMGDDIRHLNWKMTARTHQLHTKVFQEEASTPVYIVLDHRKKMFFGTKNTLKISLAKRIAASILGCAFSKEVSFGMLIFDDNYIESTPLLSTKKDLFRAIAKLQSPFEKPKKVFKDTENILKTIEKTIPHDVTVFFISDFSDISNYKEHAHALQRKKVIHPIFVYDIIEKELPKSRFFACFKDRALFLSGTESSTKEKNNSQFERRHQSVQEFATERFVYNMYSTVENTQDILRSLYQ